MSFGRMQTPRCYMDNVNWAATRGTSRDDMITVITTGTGVALNSGYTKYQMFDMDVINQSSFATGTGTGIVSITIDFGSTGFVADYICIMNHNLKSADGKIRVNMDTVPITAVNDPSSTQVGLTEVFNGDVDGSDYATPDTDGDTLLLLESSINRRYWQFEFEYVTTAWDEDLVIGEIVFGEYYTMPISPDLPVSRGTTHESNNITRSYGGKSYGTAGWVAANEGLYSAFRLITDNQAFKMAGREYFDFSVGYVSDTDIYPEDRQTPLGDSVLYDVINKSATNLIPFIFAADSGSVLQGDYLYCRFEQNSFDTVRKAWKVESFRLRVVQEF